MLRVVFVGSLLVALLGAGIPQEKRSVEQQRTADLIEFFARVEQADPSARVGLLRGFLDGRPPQNVAAIKVRLRLATELLRGFSVSDAATEFRAVIERAKKSERDTAARALYGLAQCEELLGHARQCSELLRRLRQEYRDLRFARYATAALKRIAGSRSVRIGRPVPELTAARDLTGRPQSLASRRGRPVLMLFVAPDDPRMVEYANRLLGEWRRAGLAEDDVVLFAATWDVVALRSVVKAASWRGAIVPCVGAFLQPAMLQFGVQALPDSCLVGPDGTLLLRSPTRGDLRKALRVLTG